MSQEQMVEGYLAGLASKSVVLPECHAGRSAAFRHGWLNGRDDRVNGPPRERAEVLRRRAEMMLGVL